MTKPFNFLLVATCALALVACGDDDETTVDPAATSSFEVEFDNVVGDGAEQRDLSLAAVDATDYPFTNDMGQDFNLTMLKYFISDVTLHGDGVDDYRVPMEASVDVSRGYFLIDEASGNQFVNLTDVPVGDYNGMSFTVGIDSAGVEEGATGGILDPVVNGMWWSWNAGYVAVKVEGQSPASPGGARGNTIDTTAANGFVYHIGGWKERPGTRLAYNNRRVRIDFDDDATVAVGELPHVHLEFDVARLFGAERDIDFSLQNNVHSPADNQALGFPDNIERAFRYDHIH